MNAWQPMHCLVSYECKEQPGRQPASLSSRLAIQNLFQEPANNPETTADEGDGFETTADEGDGFEYPSV